MKKTLYFNLLLLAVVFCTTGFSGCKEDVESVWVVTATESSYTFEAEGGDKVLPVISNQTWTVSLEFDGETNEWASLSSAGNNSDEAVILLVNTNFTNKTRTATVIFESQGKEPRLFEISQKGAAIKTSSIKSFTAYGGSQKVGVSSLVAWTFSKPEADTWYSVTRESDSLTIAVNPILSKENRTSKLKISASGLPDKTVSIEQNKAKINVNVITTLEVGYAGIDKEIEVDCPIAWTIENKTFAEWIPELKRRVGVDESYNHYGIIDVKTWANPYFFARTDFVNLIAQGLDTVTIKISQKPWDSDGMQERNQSIAIWDPDDKTNSVVMKQGTSKIRRKEFTYSLNNVKANTRLAITFQNRTFGNASMFGATGNGEINGSSGDLQYVFVPYVSSENDIVKNGDGSWTFNESVITPWTIKQAGNYDITLVLKDALDAVSYIRFDKK